MDLFIGRNFVVSIHRGRVPALEEALARWTRGGPRLREGVGFLVYAVMDAIIDSFAPFLADMEEEIEETEFAVFARSDEESVRSLLRLKRTLASLRRELHPLRAIFEVLLRRDHPFFPGSTEVLSPRCVRPPPADPGHCWMPSARWRPPRWTHRWQSARTGSTRR